jgi:sulfhydrogenase subunit delta
MSGNGTRPKVAVHKFSSCDGCQLAFLNLGEDLLRLAELVDIRHFAEAGTVKPDARVDVAFVEGSITTPDEEERIRAIRDNAVYLVTMGACATSGGLQALRNGVENHAEWVADIYASPEYIRSLPTSTAISRHVKVDLELWGCPVTSRQIVQVVRDLLFGVAPSVKGDSVCAECKRKGNVCVLVSRGEPCMGPVTRTGCGALCPAFGRACYACFGPSEQVNGASLSRRLMGLGLHPDEIAQRYQFINSAAEPYRDAAESVRGEGHD